MGECDYISNLCSDVLKYINFLGVVSKNIQKWEICKPLILQNYHLEKVHPYHKHHNLTCISPEKSVTQSFIQRTPFGRKFSSTVLKTKSRKNCWNEISYHLWKQRHIRRSRPSSFYAESFTVQYQRLKIIFSNRFVENWCVLQSRRQRWDIDPILTIGTQSWNLQLKEQFRID